MHAGALRLSALFGRQRAAEVSGYVVALGLVLVLGGCTAVRPINAPPEDVYSQARTIPDIEGVRYWGDEVPAWITGEGREEQLERRAQDIRELGADDIAAGRPIEINYLALSGGGEDGAFGAGILNGWTEAGTRPEFDAVTGISTGSLIAPFAFLGPDWDDELAKVYTHISEEDIFILRPWQVLFGGISLASTAPLRATVEKYATPEMLEQIAAEHRRGRRLLIGTANIDAGRPVVWDIGVLANSGHPDALGLFHDILVASASIPGVFPPVTFDVDVDGTSYIEAHVDGGIGNQVFAYPPSFSFDTVDERVGYPIHRTLYVLRNSKLNAPYEEVQPSVIKISARTISVLIKQQGKGDVFRIYALTQRDGIDFRLMYLPDDFKLVAERPFDREYMEKLYDFGYNAARSGVIWLEEPPGTLSAFQTQVSQ